MRKLIKLIYIAASLAFVVYLIMPSPAFPPSLVGSFRSVEPADSETPLRRSYFTDFGRSEVMKHYNAEYGGLRLNYPPEESQTLIRDQARATYLEEIVQPLKGSLFVNGFKPSLAKDEINYKGVHYNEKITIKLISSSRLVRVSVGLASVLLLWLIIESMTKGIKELFVVIKR